MLPLTQNAGLNSYTVSDLMVFNIDGTHGQVIVAKGANGWELQAHAKWSPDGTQILGTAKCKDPQLMIWYHGGAWWFLMQMAQTQRSFQNIFMILQTRPGRRMGKSNLCGAFRFK